MARSRLSVTNKNQSGGFLGSRGMAMEAAIERLNKCVLWTLDHYISVINALYGAPQRLFSLCGPGL